MRLFAAIDLPVPLREQLASMCLGVPGARWVPAENMHLTLRFIGEVDGGVAEDVIDALAEVRQEPFELTLEGVGHFETARQPHALWAGVAASPALLRLQASVDGALQRIGLPPEGRKYMPHVTLARLKQAPPDRVQAFLVQHSLFRSDPFPVEEFSLYSSFLGRKSATYRVEAGFGLSGKTGHVEKETLDDWNPWASEE